MNRLILLGNGFDLAHGMKTGYNDFIIWYLKRAFITAFQMGTYSDSMINIQRNRGNYYLPYSNYVADLVDRFYTEGLQPLLGNQAIDGLSNPFVVKIDSTLLKTLLYNCTQANWVDIENEFYHQLKSILNRQVLDSEKEKSLASLNQSLKCIIDQLECYLESLQPPPRVLGYEEIITSPILQKDTHGIVLDKEELPDETMILNFNYTDTICKYLEEYHLLANRPVPKIVYIHGRIKTSSNPLVFGFGDELDDAYIKMERETAKGYFEYIKSFWYFKTSNYRELTSFINSNPFQIYILGHSCGLSDRTMLHMIFEHSNCRSIKIYYHGNKKDNNYTSITHEIARHFKDKSEMRNRIVSLDRSSPMPQVSY